MGSMKNTRRNFFKLLYPSIRVRTVSRPNLCRLHLQTLRILIFMCPEISFKCITLLSNCLYCAFLFICWETTAIVIFLRYYMNFCLVLTLSKILSEFAPIKVPVFIWWHWNPASLLEIIYQNRFVQITRIFYTRHSTLAHVSAPVDIE